MSAKIASQTSVPKPCATISDPQTADLTWLMHRAVSTLSTIFDTVCREAGLVDLRDWLVLATVSDGERRTQHELSQVLGIDKSTLMAIIDRLEKQDLVSRELSPTDRRVRYPITTTVGTALAEKVAQARAHAIAEHLRVIPDDNVVALRSTLWSVLTGEPTTTPTHDPQLAATSS